MKKSWKDQFQASHIKLRHDNPTTFVMSQWQYDKETPSILYLLIRIAILITFFVIWLLTITMQNEAGRVRWAIYLTNWGLSLCLIQSFLACFLVFGAYIDNCMRGKYSWNQTISRMYPVYWGFNVTATVVAFTITLVYWTLVYSAEGSYWSTINFMVHGFNSILMLTDFWIVSHPVHLLHSVYPLILAVCYLFMTAMYYIAGGTTASGSKYIYPILKWDQPGYTIGMSIGTMVIMVILHTLTYFMYKLRKLIFKKIYGEYI